MNLKSETKGTKYRLLFLMQYMLNNTDEDHPVTKKELEEIYAHHGYRADRNTIRDDFKALEEAGVIVEYVQNGRRHDYFISNRRFELPELKMLVDAVSSSQFIPADKSRKLIDKLASLTNTDNREKLTARIFVADQIKSDNQAMRILESMVLN